MRITEEKLMLRDGRELTLRSPEEKDAQSLLDYLTLTSEETHFLIRYPDEINFTLEGEKEIINRTLESSDSVWFTVFDGDKVAGNCAIGAKSDKYKMKHRCDVAIALAQAYCDTGLGSMLFERAIEKAKSLGFEQLELGVYADNARAIALYKKMGFEECGRIPRAFRLRDGSYIDEILMVRSL